MSETTASPLETIKSSTRKKVLGVPVLYVAGGLVAVLAVYAWKAKKTVSETAASADTFSSTDASAPIGEAFPELSSGTVVVAPATPAATVETGFESNDEWIKAGISQLEGESPTAVQGALQAYLNGQQISYQQGRWVDSVLRMQGAPPFLQDVGGVAAETAPVRPSTPSNTPTPAPDNVGTLRQSIAAAYRSKLGRDASSSEIDFWVATGQNAGQITASIGQSEEAKRRGVASYYRQYLGRSPKQSEVDFWMNTGKSLTGIERSIAGSDEAKMRR